MSLKAACLLSAAILGSFPTVASGSCALSSVEPSVGVAREHWSEYSRDDRRIVLETGRLEAFELALSGTCGGLSLKFDLIKQSGVRQYEGFSNRGQAVRTASDIDVLGLVAKATYTTDLASISLFGASRQSDRVIRSKGAVAGYPEEFEQYFAGAAVGKHWNLNTELSLNLSGFVSVGKGSMAVELPGADRLRLTLGQTRARGGQLKVGYTPIKEHRDWKTFLLFDANTEATEAGRVATVYQDAVPISAAYQPRFTLKTRSVRIGIERTF